MDTIHEVEVVIHVDDALNTDERAAMVANLQARDGVVHVRFTPGRNHLMVIGYDSGRLHASDVLNYVKQEHANAELIGI
jgi:hypothetical protein